MNGPHTVHASTDDLDLPASQWFWTFGDGLRLLMMINTMYPLTSGYGTYDMLFGMGKTLGGCILNYVALTITIPGDAVDSPLQGRIDKLSSTGVAWEQTLTLA